MATIQALRTLMTGRLFPWVIVVFMVAGAAHAATPTHHAGTSFALRALTHRVVVLEHACVPMRTGGGVTQCTQPSIPGQRLRREIIACLNNAGAYQGMTGEDTEHLFAQCLDDWDVSHP